MKNPSMIFGSEKGFTFVEIIITAVVVLIAIIGFVDAGTAIQNATTAAYERTVAVQDGHRVIEAMRNTAATGSFPSNVTAAYPSSGTVSGYDNLTNESIVVTYVSSSANPLDATVTISYKENGKRDVSIALRTYITQRS